VELSARHGYAGNHSVIEEWRQFTGDPAAMTNDLMEASWIGFRLWTDAVTAAGTTDVEAVRKALAGRKRARVLRLSTCGSMPRTSICTSRR